jgi:drug/metabolite transporter (DMT)-like permease
MDTLVTFSIVLSALLHAYWNFLLKSAKQPNLFIALSKILEAAVFLLPFWYFQQGHEIHLNQPYIVVIAAALVFLSYYFLGLTYQHLDMSIAYPIARSSSIFLVPLAWFFLDEQLAALGIFAIVLMTLGLVLLSITASKTKKSDTLKLSVKGIVMALIVALISALQTLWSKISISQIQPFIFFYSYTFVVALGYMVVISCRYKAKSIRRELVLYWPQMLAVGLLNTASYGLFLYALTKANTAYVGSLRQLSLVFALMLGVYLLKERLTKQKTLGTVIVLIATIMLMLAS